MLGLVHQGGSIYETIAIIAFYMIAILSALILHEIAHGLVALWCGDPSAKYAGRLSLNPVRHLDPFGTICFLLFGFGWAVPVPINPNNFKHRRLGCVWVSLAGIATNLILAFVASFFYVLLWQQSVWSYLFLYMMLFNIVLATFNILPLAPLDGFNFVAALSPTCSYVRFMNQNRLVSMFLLVLLLYFTNIVDYLQNWLSRLFLDFWGLFL